VAYEVLKSSHSSPNFSSKEEKRGFLKCQKRTGSRVNTIWNAFMGTGPSIRSKLPVASNKSNGLINGVKAYVGEELLFSGKHENCDLGKG